MYRCFAWVGLTLFAASPCKAAILRAASVHEIRSQAARLAPGDVLEIAPGVYAGDLELRLIRGTPESPITVRGRDPQSPPFLEGGRIGIRLVGCSYLRLQHLTLSRFADGGIQISPAGVAGDKQQLILDSLTIRETGLRGNSHALALNGVRGVIVRRCTFEAWGGAGIDVADSHAVHVEACRFIGREASQRNCGVAVHSGSSQVTVQTSLFRWAGDHGIILGGSTDSRAPPTDPAHPCQAMDVVVAGNRIFGGISSLAWLGTHESRVHRNTLVLPHHAALTLLPIRDEAISEDCRSGAFDHNLIVLDRRVIRPVSVTERTRLAGLQLSSNVWFRVEGKSVRLLVGETGGIHDLDPGIAMDGSGDYRAASSDPRLATVGADGYQPAPAPFSLR